MHASSSRTYTWEEFGKSHTTEFQFTKAYDEEFCKRFNAGSSDAYRDYRDRLRAIALRERGLGKAEIAKELQRSQKFVQKWWNFESTNVPKPKGVHGYLASENFRNVELRRNYIKESGLNNPVKDANSIYNCLLNNSQWEGDISWTRDFRHGGRIMKYDAKGSMRQTSHQKSSYDGGIPILDNALEKLFAEFDLTGLVSRVALNWYPDGNAVAGAHRHDCWTALLSFGHERVLSIDNHPLLMQNGDLVIFGTQRHGVPKMLNVHGGRISIAIFFWPSEECVKESFQTIKGDEEPRKDTLALTNDTHEVSESYVKDSYEEQWEQYSEHSNQECIQDSDDVQEKCEDTDLEVLDDNTLNFLLEVGIDLSSEEAKMIIASTKETKHKTNEKDSITTTELQIQSVVKEEDALQVQFKEYELAILADEYDDWDGRTGDLMARYEARELLTSGVTASPIDIFSLGIGRMTERSFLERIQKTGMAIVYDLRDKAPRDGPFCPYNLRNVLTEMAVFYKHKPIGRQSAGGVLSHLDSDEGKHTLAEIVWQARRERTVFVGSDENWKEDLRAGVSHVLCQRGHKVYHIGDGCFEKEYELHDHDAPVPLWLVHEQKRLAHVSGPSYNNSRMSVKQVVDVSAQGQIMAEMNKNVSSEMLEEIEQEIRRATNQTELNKAQKRKELLLENGYISNVVQVQHFEDKHEEVVNENFYTTQRRWGKKKSGK